MEVTPKLAFFIIVASIFTFFLVDLGYTSFVAGDVNDSLESSIKSSMQASINKGDLRVNEKLSMNRDQFIVNFKGSYQKNQSVKNADLKTNFYKVSEEPPMAAVEVLGKSNSYFKRFMGEDSNIVYYKKQIVIMEKK